MTHFPDDILELARRIVADFAQRGLRVATAESCTGGLIAGALTEISGSSAVVDRGFVTYTQHGQDGDAWRSRSNACRFRRGVEGNGAADG